MTRQSFSSLISDFLQDTRGNYALMTIIAAVPLFGAVALAVDYSEMSRERQMTLNALDAAGIATAQRILEGASDTDVRDYAGKFFNANLGNINPDRAKLTVILPKENVKTGTLKMSASLSYDPVFFGTFQSLMGKQASALSFAAATEVKLKNTIEVALVLDNSGSMDYIGSGSGKKRMVVLKDAAKQLVDTMAAESAKMKQVDKPVQIGLVPFSASVNVGPANRVEAWMDTTGVSPVHHENFDWSSFGTSKTSPNQYVEDLNGMKWARGKDWGVLKDKVLTRFTLYDTMQRIASSKTVNNKPTYTYANPISWEGCVESRPYPYNVTDAVASKSTPATMFVPMFGPDEVGNIWTEQQNSRGQWFVATFGSNNNWWDDSSQSTDSGTATQLKRQKNMPKYFAIAPQTASMPEAHEGPNASCTTTAILPLTDISNSTGVTRVKSAINGMISLGATNVPEGMAWGWRVLSSQAPFIGGRSETERGNDKVVIVLTDGENTYYTPSSLRNNDNAGLKSTYSSLGYAGLGYNTTTTPRIFMNTSVSKSTHTNDNYAKAMNQQFSALCSNAKAAGVVVMTVALDLNLKDTGEKAQIEALSACASDSRFRKDSSGKAAKLFWNSTGATLADDFKSIADELSNLRIVS
ncbi:pilus assembly protein [Tianweitania sp.]|uniref:TadE/TadG family type IV pilus assembly protein n=1 Tax=Tianweitania sp. TaxID=2021634 RepID=UPI002897C34C|nr:pilus assembly protein [Tianweitania sp.]